jgi:hypothetical protein
MHRAMSRVRTLLILTVLVALGLGASLILGLHQPRPTSDLSFGEISALVQGKTAAEVARLLGEPDSRQRIYDTDEKWIWWRYTSLDGEDVPPEVRGRVVHLEIVFRNPGRPHEASRPYSEWLIDGSLGVNYRTPVRED